MSGNKLIFNPMDPLGVLQAWTDAANRAQGVAVRMARQHHEQRRMVALAACIADVDAAYLAFRQQADDSTADNLARACEHYRKVASGELAE